MNEIHAAKDVVPLISIHLAIQFHALIEIEWRVNETMHGVTGLPNSFNAFNPMNAN